ncbi:MAG: site-specific DNA-methyltransferase [Prevotellaceae bacterium]|nr:site-specific DNA-methyltransferase [Prevotellaceae bacterium]
MLDEPLETAREKAQGILEAGPWPRFYFTDGGRGGIRRKVYADDVGGRIATNFWEFKEVGHTDEAVKEIISIFGRISFPTPKPTRLVERILRIATKKDSIVLDCCAGSGTTGHATLLANWRDGGSRRFILVEMMDYAETLTAERMRRVMSGCPFKSQEKLYEQKLTVSRLRKPGKMMAEADAKVEASRGKYDKVEVKVDEDKLKVIGTKYHTKRLEGRDGEFDYYELGVPLFTAEGELNPSVDEETLRSYVYYTETRQPLTRKRSEAKPWLLDCLDGIGYYFYYDPCAPTTLSIDTLGILSPTEASRHVVYADICTLDERRLAGFGITFKKIPRDISKF